MNSNLFARLNGIFLNKAEHTCMYLEDGSVWTYRDLLETVRITAGLFRKLGLRKGDRVIAQTGKCPEAVALYLACLQTGCTYVPLNTAYTKTELSFFVEDTEPKLLVTETELRDFEQTVPIRLTLNEDGEGSFPDAISESEPNRDIETTTLDEVAAILYTSGTTGRSKGAMLTHGNLESNARVLLEYWGWRDEDVLLHALPIFHVHGLFVALHCVFLSGTSMIFQSRFHVEKLIEQLPNATVLMGVPTFYIRLLQQETFDREIVKDMRLFISGSAPLSEQTFHEFHERTGFRILERYGMSETLMNTSNPLDGERIPGTVGFPLPDVMLRIANDEGCQVARGEVGQIELKGPNVFPGYWRLPEKSNEEFRNDGFFKTGDMGVQDAEGRVSIVGREKDVIISGGFNVYPAEVEAAIDEIDGVRENAVIGAPHPDFGEGVVAVLVSDREISVKEVSETLGKKLARFKQPKSVKRMDELPRNAMGKVQKNALRQLFRDSFGN